ncbi:metastasis-associated protein MTA3-like isoform X2 [Babylonia areolata]|uniref:metastasis-associated protein MTA3-like isoform X2 n=1 Tax=Babylonia areolata TaxID=304850 RepID=UPI003FD6928F
MAANMYRVGDYVYFESSSTSPYTIRRIEELNKTPNGNVEAKVMCFYRRRDISNSLILLADKHHSNQMEDDQERKGSGSKSPSPTPDAQNGTENSNGNANSNSNSSGNGNDANAATTTIANTNTTTTATNNTATTNNNNNSSNSNSNPGTEDGEPKPFCDIPEKQRHQLKHRELFLSRQVETLPATHIRGKCVVTLLNETENLMSYLNKEDTFFYSLVYDPQQKTLLADKGEIRVGSKFQAEIVALLKEGEVDERDGQVLETLEWSPDNNLSKKEIDQFLVIARSVGTFARALDCTSTVRQPSLHMSAAAASRDITLFHAMNTLHKHNYDGAKAIRSLVPDGGPVLCRDEMEEWSASEANLFEEALDKYGKDFNDIRQDFLPWKSLKSIVEYYYMWKTTDRYVQQKRIKAAEAESKLKQVYIPNYNKPSPAALPGKVNGADGQVSGRACESCYTAHSTQWYSWGPAHMQCRLCSACWMYWKKYGGLKMPTRLERVAHMNSMRTQKCTITGCGKEFKLKTHLARHLATAHGLTLQGAGGGRPVVKARAAFCLVTTPITRLSRYLCKDILRPRHAARCCYLPVCSAAIKQECHARLMERGGRYSVPRSRPHKHCSLEPVVSRLGIDITAEKPSVLRRGAMAERNPQEQPKVSSTYPSIMKKRGYEQSNGVDGPTAKRPNMGVIRQAGPAIKPPSNSPRGLLNHGSLNGRGRMPSMRGSKMHMISWLDMPDDVFFVATDATRKLRKQLQQTDFKRAARNPWRALNVKTTMPMSAMITPRERSSPALASLPSQEVVVLD